MGGALTMAARPATIRVLDSNPQSTLERTTTVPIFNGDSLARVLRAVISPQRMLGWSLGIVYLWFGALKLAHLSPVLELIRRTSPLLATAPFYTRWPSRNSCSVRCCLWVCASGGRPGRPSCT